MTNDETLNKITSYLLGEDYYNYGADTDSCNDLLYEDIVNKYKGKSKHYLDARSSYRISHKNCEYCKYCKLKSRIDLGILYKECSLSEKLIQTPIKAKICPYYTVPIPKEEKNNL